MNRFSAKRSLI